MPRGVYERKENPSVTEMAKGEKAGADPLHRTRPADDLTSHQYEYMALKPMKVEGEMVAPGDIVSGAHAWRNVHNYVAAGSLTPVSNR